MKIEPILESMGSGGGRSVELSNEEAVELVKTKCSKALEAYARSPMRIVRGHKNTHHECLLTDPKRFKRTSIEEYSYHIHIMDLTWPHNYPKRSEGVICQTMPSRQIVSVWGPTYIVFPFDGAKMVWNKVGRFNLYEAFYTTNEHTSYPTIPAVGETLHGFGVDDTFSGIVNLSKTRDSLRKQEWEVIKDLFNPKSLGYVLVNKISDLRPNDGELWTDSKCVLIRHATAHGLGLLPS